MTSTATNGYGRLIIGSVLALAGTLLVTVILGLFSMTQKVALTEERYRHMILVDQEQSAQLTTCLQAQHDLQRQLDLVRERQDRNTKAIESHSQLIGGIVTLNAEQQYQINLLQERMRLLERASRRSEGDHP